MPSGQSSNEANWLQNAIETAGAPGCLERALPEQEGYLATVRKEA